MILDILFQSKVNAHVKKHKLLVRKIVNRLLKKFGEAYVT
jgi:hypothetical protein